MASKRAARDVDVHIGNRVRIARHERNMTQEGLALRLGITFQQVQKYENGNNRISAGRLHHIAVIMGLPITFFFDGLSGNSKIDPTTFRANKFLTTREGIMIADAFPRLGKRAQQTVLDLVKAGGSQKTPRSTSQ
jgi:transcriptional regulator with XRE-family HTH domain